MPRVQLETPLDQLLETGAHVRVAHALVRMPQGFAASARDVARRAGVAHTTGARVLRGWPPHAWSTVSEQAVPTSIA